MKPLFGYIFLVIGILFGITANSFAKISDGFTKLTPSTLCILFMCITMFCIAKAMHTLPVGFAYSRELFNAVKVGMKLPSDEEINHSQNTV